MKRLFLSLIIVLTSTFQSNAQFYLLGKQNQHTVYGGEEGKTYAAILTTPGGSRQEAISKTIEFLLKYDFVDNKEEALNMLEEYDDTQSEFTIPVTCRFGFHGSAPVMGAVASLPPMYLNLDLLFQFYDNGKIRLIFKNFSEYTYMMKNPTFKSAPLPQDVLPEDEYGRYYQHFLGPQTKAGLGKLTTQFLVFANQGIEKIDDFYAAMDDYMSNIDEQIEIMKILVEKGAYVFVNPEQVFDLYKESIDSGDNMTPKSLAAQLETLQKEYSEGKLLFVSDIFWRGDIKREFDYILIYAKNCLGGQIEAIAEDGEISWQMEGDKLMPVDAALKKTMVKKGLDYFSYYEN